MTEETFAGLGGDAGPLDGLVVIETGVMLSVPNAGRMLADFGATVIKVEHPAFGDHSRDFGPQADGVGVWWKRLNRNKLCVTLDLKSDEGQSILGDLIEEADVLLENFRPGTLERWGIGPDVLADRNPGLIILRLSGFGQYGPYAEKPGFGTLAEAMSGFAATNGFPDKPPLLPPTGLSDQIAGLYGVLGVMFALFHREVNGGEGQVIDVSLIESMLDVLGPQALRYDQLGEKDTRSGNRSTASAPRNVYRSKDDQFVAIAASTQPLAKRVLEAVGGEELREDPRFADNERRLANKEALNEIIVDWMAEHTRDEIIEIFDEHDATIAPVYDIEDMLADRHYEERDVFRTIEDDELGSAVVQDRYPKFSETPGEIRHLGPTLGEHNELVYGSLLGYSAAELEDLAASEVI